MFIDLQEGQPENQKQYKQADEEQRNNASLRDEANFLMMIFDGDTLLHLLLFLLETVADIKHNRHGDASIMACKMGIRVMKGMYPDRKLVGAA